MQSACVYNTCRVGNVACKKGMTIQVHLKNIYNMVKRLLF